MKFQILFILAVILGLMSCSNNKEKNILLYVGTYSDNNSEGIYCYSYQKATAKLSGKSVTPNQENPSFLAISSSGKYLYAVSEILGTPQRDSGSVSAYKIKPTGELEEINNESTGGHHPAHVCVSPDGKYVVAANYTSGSLSIFDVRDDGGLSEMKQLIQHIGMGQDMARQKEPHAHSSQFTPDGKILISCDLGTNNVNFYQLSPDGNRFVPTGQDSLEMEPGSGPRHFDFSPDGKFIYVMNEMKASVAVLKKDGDRFDMIETVSALPADYDGIKAGADIHVSSDGKFVYGSVRGHNSIAVFKRADDGAITRLENVSVEGDWPRNFALSPDGNYLLAANRRSNNITVFKINKETGLPTYTGESISVPNPVCLKFLVQ